MSHIVRRLCTKTPSISSATSVAGQFLALHQSHPPSTQSQFLDANQLQRLSASLSRPELASTLPAKGTLLPPCWHLAYFTPSQIEQNLGRDGTDRSFNPPVPFTRRMWAGGELEWVKNRGLSVGEEVKEVTKLLSAEGKVTRAGEEMVLVGVEKRFENQDGLCLVDRR